MNKKVFGHNDIGVAQHFLVWNRSIDMAQARTQNLYMGFALTPADPVYAILTKLAMQGHAA